MLCVPLVLIGLTGSVLVFEDELRSLLAPPAAPGSMHTAGEIVAAARKSAPDGLIASTYTAPPASGLPATVRLLPPGRASGPSEALRVDVDPVTLAATPNPSEGFLRQVFFLHSTLLLKNRAGRQLAGWFGVAMLAMAVSGLVNWWPPRASWRAAFTVSPASRGYRLWRELHGAVGIWALAVFATVSLAGVYLAFPDTGRAIVDAVLPARDLRAEMAALKVEPAKGEQPLDLDGALAEAQTTFPGSHVTQVFLPARPDQPYRINLLRRAGPVRVSGDGARQSLDAPNGRGLRPARLQPRRDASRGAARAARRPRLRPPVEAAGLPLGAAARVVRGDRHRDVAEAAAPSRACRSPYRSVSNGSEGRRMIKNLRVMPALPALLFAFSARADDPAPAAPAVDPAAALRATLPHDLSPWSMFLTADSIVKAMMVGLAIASVITWTVWLAKAIELHGIRRRLRQALTALDAAGSLAEARQTETGAGADLVDAALAELICAPEASPEGIKERVASRLERIEAAAGRAMSRGTGILATIGATAPFVGLFGTVWGIMNSFIGISKAQTTNLAVVAPGIAEALLATAMGLVAAIPAVVIYNMFARQTAGCRALVGDAAAAVLRLVSRELDRGARAPKLRAAAE